MAEKTFKSPNFFEREIEILSGQAPVVPNGTPVGVIGTAEKGPAFVPVTLANFSQFQETFGDVNQNKPATYAIRQFFNNRNSGMFLRILGAGANDTLEDILQTEASGTVKNAGFVLPTAKVKFLNAIHTVQSNEIRGDRTFTDNDSVAVSTGGVDFVSLNRAVIMLPDHVDLKIFSSSADVSISLLNNTSASTVASALSGSDNQIVLVLSSSSGSLFASDNGIAGAKIFTVSLDPSNKDYIGKVLNTDATKINESGHYLYAHFPVEASVASVKFNSSLPAEGAQPEYLIATGSTAVLNSIGLSFDSVFRKYDARYNFAKSTKYISQPFGSREHDLFHFESMDDGAAGNGKVKITIADLKMSVDEGNKYGSFTVQIRSIDDSDYEPVILEEFRECSLNPDSSNYIARKIGDRRLTFNFDAEDKADRRLVASGKYANQSRYVRVVVSQAVDNKQVPETALPFGFRGLEVINTGITVSNSSSQATNTFGNVTSEFFNTGTLTVVSGGVQQFLKNAIVPPVPYRLKLTRGNLTSSLTNTQIAGTPSAVERVMPGLCWGVKFDRTQDVMNPNSSLAKSELVDNLSKFFGINKLSAVITGSAADQLNNNKFSLSKVALGFESIALLTSSLDTVRNNMKSAIYFRDSLPDASDSYKLLDKQKTSTTTKLISFASLTTEPNVFNQYSQFMKFSNFMAGGFDGLNIFDKNLSKMNDKATSVETGGCAEPGYVTPGVGAVSGESAENSAVNSYKIAIDIMTNPLIVNHNLFIVPGIRDSLITDYISAKIKSYGLSLYVMDIPSYDDSLNRLFDDSTAKPDIDKTIQVFQNRYIDNNFVATYFPDVFIDDVATGKRIKMPASLAALGALGFNDRTTNVWFAPAGFNRASLDFVRNVTYRLTTDDRNKLYEARINPIAVFPRQGFVIYGQKTLQIAKSALDRVNVRRLLLEIKKGIINISNELVFEINNRQTKNRFITSAQQLLNAIRQQSGVERFQVLIDESQSDEQKLACRVIVIPTRSIEFIAIDFIITPSGVQFV